VTWWAKRFWPRSICVGTVSHSGFDPIGYGGSAARVRRAMCRTWIALSNPTPSTSLRASTRLAPLIAVRLADWGGCVCVRRTPYDSLSTDSMMTPDPRLDDPFSCCRRFTSGGHPARPETRRAHAQTLVTPGSSTCLRDCTSDLRLPSRRHNTRTLFPPLLGQTRGVANVLFAPFWARPGSYYPHR